MKFEIGQKAMVRKDLEAGKRYGELNFFGDNMGSWSGKTVTISEHTANGNYCVKENSFYWSDEMLEPISATGRYTVTPATLSTGDMINELMANPEQRYLRAMDNGIYGLDDVGTLKHFEYGHYYSADIRDTWTLVPEPSKSVLILDAMEAYFKGKEIICEYDGVEFTHRYNPKRLEREVISFHAIKDSKWYIKE